MNNNRPTTLEEIEALPKNILTPADVARYMGVDPYSINCACKKGTMPFAFMMGSRVMIPKEAFLHYNRYGAVVRDVGFHPELD